MGWGLGWDSNWNRWVGYGVPAWCDLPTCTAKIDRGLSYVCGGDPHGGEHGCGLFFCEEHLRGAHSLCPRCFARRRHPFTAKPEHPEWVHHVATDASWAEWRAENPGVMAGWQHQEGR